MTEIPARQSVVTLGARDSSPAPLADRQLADAVLEQGLHNVLALLGRAPKLTNRADITAEPPSERRMTKRHERGGRASPAVGYPSQSTIVQSRAGRPSCTDFCRSPTFRQTFRIRLWPAAATMCSMRGRCRMHDVGISFAYLGDARNNVGKSVGAEI
jgi:hypothetical protein